MKESDLCPMSDLPPDQCALPCHQGVNLPAGVAPEVRRGVEPSGEVTSLTPPAAEQHEDRDTRPRPRRPRPPKGACHYDEAAGQWMTPEHTRGCVSTACDGCRPCGKDHCALFGSCPNHVQAGAGEHTCPSCIGEVRDNIAEIVTLTALVSLELEHAGITAEVVNLAGPFADPDQWDSRRDHTETGRGWCEWPRLHDDHHPGAVFTRLERDLRREYEQPRIPTEYAVWPLPQAVHLDVMSRSADYFTTMLAGRFPHDEPFEKFARDLRRLRTFLENVLSDSRAPETGAPCPTCAEDLHRKLEGKKPPRLVLHRSHWCENPECTREHDDKGVNDVWVCPYDGAHRWKAADYQLRVARDYLAHASALTADQIHQQYDIPASTVRRWGSTTTKVIDGKRVERPPLLKPAGRTESGVKLWPVDKVLELREQQAAHA